MNFTHPKSPIIYWPVEIPATTFTFTPAVGSPTVGTVAAGRYVFADYTIAPAIATALGVSDVNDLIGDAIFSASSGAVVVSLSGYLAGVLTVSPNPEFWGIPAAGIAVGTGGASQSFEIGGHYRPGSIAAEYREASTGNTTVTETVSGSTSYRTTWGVRTAGVLTCPFVYRANLFNDALQSGEYLTAAGRTFPYNNTLEDLIIAARTERRMVLCAGAPGVAYPYPDRKNALVSIVDEGILSDPRNAISEVDGGRYGDITLPLRRISYFPD